MRTPIRQLAPVLLTAAVAIAAALWPVAHAVACTSLPQPESRTAAADADALFVRGSSVLTPGGALWLAGLARQVAAADIEVVVVSLPQPVGLPAAAWRPLGLQRALAAREQLVRHGVPRERVYTELRPGAPADPLHARAAATVLVDTIAAWPTQVAGRAAVAATCLTLPPGAAGRTQA